MAENWSQIEVELIVADYFQMLNTESAGKLYSKAEHRRALLPLLNNRTEGSIEFKHQNISAVLIKLGAPYIAGYKPAWNYQKALEDVVARYITQHQQVVERTFDQFVATPPPIISSLTFETLVEDRPIATPTAQVEEAAARYRKPIKVNYLEVEQNNRIIGASGEQIVLDYERWRLRKEGKDAFADQIEWVSKTQGDGLGFDILSRNRNGTDRYIEVKSTKLTKEAPIFFTRNEYEFAKEKRSNFHLYRVFNLKAEPKMFIADGSYDDFCRAEAVQYKGYF